MMNSRTLSLTLGLSLFTAVGIGCQSDDASMASFNGSNSSFVCSSTPVHPVSTFQAASVDSDMHMYEYHPSKEVYLDVDSGTYFWQQGERWMSGSMLPSSIDLRSSDSVQIPLYTATPYRVHASVTAMFPGWASAGYE